MKNWVIFFAISLIGEGLFAQQFLPVDNSSVIRFTIRNFGLNVSGSVKGLSGKIQFDPANISNSFVTASVAIATINTGIGLRDEHLKKEDYFDVVKYPQLSFTSDKIIHISGAGSFLVEGIITIRGISKKISFPFTATPKPDGYLFEAVFTINRRDFGVGGNSFVLSDNVTISLAVTAKKIN